MVLLKRVLTVAVVLMMSVMAQAKPITLSDSKQFTFTLDGTRIASFLSSFFSDQGYNFHASSALNSDRRTLNGARKGTPAEVLDSVVRTTGIVLYFDGSTVYGYRGNEVQSTYISVDKSDIHDVSVALKELSLADNFNLLKVHSQSGLIELTGTPEFIDQIVDLVDSISGKLISEQEVRFYPLEYAWAVDNVYKVGNSSVKVPGVATLLQQIYGIGKRDPMSSTGQSATGSSRGTTADFSNALRLGNLDSDGSKKTNDSNDQITSFNVDIDGTLVNVVADPYHNGLIFRGPRSKITEYEKIVSALDTPVKIIEIEATIIDVDSSKINEIGVDWYANQDNVELGFSPQAGVRENLISALTGDSVQSLQQVPGFNVGAIVSDELGFAAKLNALESTGAVKVTARPKVATLNDLEASIESSKSLYVSVPGTYESDLFEVFSGTVLRVTPHVIESGDQQKIRLLVSVEDGSLDLGDGNGQPVTNNNLVNTQAIVNEGASLLLGGLVREENVKEVVAVPLLGHIPVIGMLFRHKRDYVRSSERLFLISPRIIESDGALAQSDKINVFDSNVSQKDCVQNCRRLYESGSINIF